MRDETTLESALARPQQRWHYQQNADLSSLAAAYGFGLVKNHPYLDGNKRVGFLAVVTFLGINGFDIDAPGPEVVTYIARVADGNMTEEQVAGWIRG